MSSRPVNHSRSMVRALTSLLKTKSFDQGSFSSYDIRREQKKKVEPKFHFIMIALTLLTFLSKFFSSSSSSLHISQSTNLIQCVSIDGQIGFVENEFVEPVHVINLPQSITMNSIFHRKTGREDIPRNVRREGMCEYFQGIKKNKTKTKSKQISKDMISLPQPDLVHSFHLGVPGRFKRLQKLDSTPIIF